MNPKIGVVFVLKILFLVWLAATIFGCKKKSGFTQIHLSSDNEDCKYLPDVFSENISSDYSLPDLFYDASNVLSTYGYSTEGILLLGNTSAGKTLVTQILSVNLSRLHAVLSPDKRLVVVDNDRPIGYPTTKLKTSIPEYVSNEISDGGSSSPVLYDLPDFDDTRSAVMDTASSFYNFLVLKTKVARVKLLFVIDHLAVKVGYKLHDFDSLVTHASKLVKDFSKYENSFALVVTDVDSYNCRGEYIHDHKIIEEIGEFIKAYNRTLHSHLKTEDPVNEDLTRNKIVFVTRLLDVNNGTKILSKIWFLRTPLGCGQLSKSPVMLYAKKKLTRMHESLQFVAVNTTTDFRFAVKPEVAPEIDSYIRHINNNISHVVQVATQELEGQYNLSMEQELDTGSLYLSKLHKKIEKTRVSVENFSRELEMGKLKNSVDVTIALIKLWSALGQHFSMRMQYLLYHLENSLTFIDKIAETFQYRDVQTWANPVVKFIKVFEADADWISFCYKLETRIQTYEFQRTQNMLPPKLESEWWLEYILRNNISAHAELIKPVAERLSPIRLRVLDSIMNFSLSKIAHVCDASGYILFYQNFLLMETAVESLSAALSDCKRFTGEVVLFGAHTIFLNSMTIFENVSISIIAPNLVNSEGRDWNIRLLGKRGSKQDIPDAVSGKNGTGENGKDGCAGNPGFPGGSFFGVVGKVVSSSRLTITSIGGDGGVGQNGGSGGTGFSRNSKFPCHNAVLVTCPQPFDAWDEFLPVVGFGYINYGIRGGNGGNGGNGGVGGIPGKHGILKFVDISNETLVQLETRNADYGLVGNGGNGGVGGKAGFGYKCGWNPMFNCIHIEASHGRGPGLNGLTGKHNASSACLQHPNQPFEINPWEKMLQYKQLYAIHAHPVTLDFITNMDTSEQTSKYSTSEGFVKEFLFLEELRNLPNLRTNLQLQYDNFISKMELYFKIHLKLSGMAEQKIAHMLLASAYNSRTSLNSYLGQEIIIDVSGYFQVLKQQIESLKTVQAVVAIQNLRERFESDIQKKVTQAVYYIEEVLQPSIIIAGEEIEIKLKEFENQLKHLIKDAKVSLEESKIRLQRAEAHNRILRIFKIFTAILTIGTTFGIGKAFSGIAKVGNTLESTFAGNEADLEKLRELVKEAERLVQDLENKNKILRKEFVPVVDTLVRYFKNVSKSLSRGEEITSPEISITKWQVISKLRDCMSVLNEFADSALKSHRLVRAFDRIHDTMNIILELYINIEDYHETQKLGTYIANVHSASLDPIRITDTKFAHFVNTFEQTLRQNLLKQEIEKAIHAFKQWVFPFAKFYLYAPSSETSNAITELGNQELELIEKLTLDLQRYKTGVVGSVDTYIFQTNFSSGLKSSKPFYTWNNDKWQNEIEALLLGKTVQFDANVRQQAFSNWESIKFNLIEINFKLTGATPELQHEFDDLLDYFGMTMTHSGVSYYRFLNSYYIMTGSNQTVRYNFERDIHGNRLGTNQAYQKFRKGDYILSPFTLWTLQLRNVVPTHILKFRKQNTVGFSNLRKFIPFIDVELVGTGTYVDGAEALFAANGDMQLDKYYVQDKKSTYDA